MESQIDRGISVRLDEGKGICFSFNENNIPAWGRCELFFDSMGAASVFLDNSFTDSEVSYGQLSVITRELGIDIKEWRVQIVVKNENRDSHHVVAFPLMVEDLRHLCKWVNDYFIQLAFTHLHIEGRDCTVKNGRVINHSTSQVQEIPYRLLIEMEFTRHLHKTDTLQLL